MPKKRFEEFGKDIVSKYKEYKRIHAMEAPSPVEVHTRYENHFQYHKAFPVFLRNAAFKLSANDRYEFLSSIVPEDSIDAFNRIVLRGLQSGGDNSILNMIPDEKAREEVNLGTVTADNIDFKKMVMRAFELIDTIPGEKRQEALDKLIGFAASSASNQIDKDPHGEIYAEKAFKMIKDFGIDLDELVPEEDVYALPKDDPKKYQTKDLDKEIGELINNSTDEEYNKILNDINDNILVSATNESTELTSGIAEDHAKSAGRIVRDKTVELLNKDPLYSGKVEGEQNTTIKWNLNSKNEAEEAKFLNDALDGKIELSDKFKKDVLKIADFMERTCEYKGENAASEQSTKIYSMEGLSNRRSELKKAVQGGNKEQIKKAYDAYKAMEKDTNEMLKVASGMSDSLDMPGNVSVSRTKTFNEFYRNNPIPVSRASGVWELWNLSKKTGIPVKDFLDDPIKSFNDAARKYGFENTAVANYLRNTSVADIALDPMAKEIGKISGQDFHTMGFIARSMELLTSCCTQNQIENNMAAEKLKHMVISPLGDQSAVISSTIIKVDYADVMERLMILEKEDISTTGVTVMASSHKNPYTGKNYEPIDTTEYLKSGKTTADRVAYKMAKIIEEYNLKKPTIENPGVMNDGGKDKFYQAVKKTCKTLLGRDVPKSDATKKFLKDLEKACDKNVPIKTEEMKSFRAFRNENLAKNLADDVERSNFKKESVMDAIQQAAKLKEKFDKSFFLFRWFGSNTKALKTLSESIENKLVEKGVSREMIDNARGFLKDRDMTGFEAVCNEIEVSNSPVAIENRTSVEINIYEDMDGYDKDGVDMNSAQLDIDMREVNKIDQDGPELE